jgi:hypothetical protein
VTNPYKHLPDHQFWRRAISCVEPHLVDPVVAPKFQIARQDRVATAGSCFAQHMSRRLAAIGFNYFVTEGGDDLDKDARKSRNYSVFSARYGNIYTVRQLLQLFQEAFGTREKREKAWIRDDGRCADPFRPTIEPDGYADPDAVAAARMEHLASVRRVFLESEVLVFTLGLTEGWINQDSGDVFPLAPGVTAGVFDPSVHKFVNFSVQKVSSDLKLFLTELKRVNPTIRVLLTVSPVSLIATYEHRHVLVSTTYSKSVLRVAAGAAADDHDWVDYFPSYEIITGSFNMGRYFEDDLREVNRTGVSHVMRCFLNNYIVGATEKSWKGTSPDSISGQIDSTAGSLWLESAVCDEELIDKVSF